MYRFLPGQTPNFEAFVAPARARAELWRVLLGFCIIGGTWVGLIFLVTFLAIFVGSSQFPQLWRAVQTGGFDLSHPVPTYLFLLSFTALIFSVWLAVTVLHMRPLRSLFGAGGGINWRHFSYGMIVIGVFTALGLGITFALDPPSRNLATGRWLIWLLPALIAVFLQTMAEELAFRGYLQQQLAARFASPLMWWVLPALVFGAMHWNPTIFGENAWLVVGLSAFMGLIVGDVTARTGNISAAMGLHFANNCHALLLVAMPGQMSGLSLFVSDIDMSDVAAMRAELLSSLAFIAAGYAIYLVVMARRRL